LLGRATGSQRHGIGLLNALQSKVKAAVWCMSAHELGDNSIVHEAAKLSMADTLHSL
jgi:hypothetical protein